jgi:shikimate dehydrogenase
MPIHESSFFIFTLVDRKITKLIYNLEMNFLSKITGSFSTPSKDNPTVAIVEAAYKHHGLDFRYLNCEVMPEDLGDAVKGARAMNWVGFNCSLPHKVEVIKYLDGLGESAELMGAVNCVVLRDGKYIGENTDGKGFLKSLKTVVSPAGKRIVILGAGGAARAIAVELALENASEIVVNRDESRAVSLVNLLNSKTNCKSEFHPWTKVYEVPKNVDILVNATSIGMAPNFDAKINIEVSSFRSELVVADVIVNPPMTNLLKDAQKAGCQIIDGLGMVINQAVLGIKYWTGEEVDPAIMRNRLLEVL